MLDHVVRAEDSVTVTLYIHDCMMVILGLYSWEYLTTCWVECQLITRKLSFKWTLMPYFLSRYCALISVATNVSLLFSTDPINCDVVLQIAYTTGALSVMTASCNLILRPFIIWTYMWYITAPLIVMGLGQFTLIIIGFRVTGLQWDPTMNGCGGGSINTTYLGVFSVYTVIFDFIVLCTTVMGLSRLPGRITFMSILVTQGVGYFLIVLVSQCIIAALVFNSVDRAVSLTSSLAAIVINSTLSCRIVRATLKTSSFTEQPDLTSTRWSVWASRDEPRVDVEDDNMFQMRAWVQPESSNTLDSSTVYDPKSWKYEPSQTPPTPVPKE